MNNKLDIAICGCGPAGLAAALYLHRQGHRVRIFERFGQPGPVGSGLILQPTGLAVLADLGLLDHLLALGARIDKLFGRVMPSGRVVLDVRYRAMGRGWQAVAVHRAALFDVLRGAVRAAGIELIAGTTIEGVDQRGLRPVLTAANGAVIGTFDLAVDALGARSPLTGPIARRTALAYGALWANVPWIAQGPFAANALEQRYRRASEMAGVLPLGRRAPGEPGQAALFWSLKRGAVADWRRQGLDGWKAQVVRLWPQTVPLLESITDHSQLTFAQYDHFTAARPYSAGLVHIGDAARSTSPQLGQGAIMALLVALALARALEGGADLTSALPAYARMRRWHVRLFQWASAMFTPFYQSDSAVLPAVRDWLTAPLSRLPVADALLARLVSGMTLPPLRGVKFRALRLERDGPAKDG